MGKNLSRNKWVVRAVWIAGMSFAIAGVLLFRINLTSIYPREVNPTVYLAFVWAFSYLTIGAIILNAKPGNREGLVLLGIGTVISLYAFMQQYAVTGMVVYYPLVLPGAKLAGWIQSWALYLIFPAGLALPFLVFPDGRLPSRRWRPILWLTVILSILQAMASFVNPGLLWVDAYWPNIHLRIYNPTGSDVISSFLDRFEYAWFLGILVPLVALIAPISRFRRARGLERQQLKWLAYSSTLILILTPLLFFGFFRVENEVAGILYIAMLTLILPATIAIAILRNQLYDIDLLINRTLVYGLLTIVLALIYFGMVTVLQDLFSNISGQNTPLSIVLSTLAIAALFSPLRRRIQGTIDRRFYRQKYDAEKTLAAFGERMREAVDQDTLAITLIDSVHQSLQPSQVSLWLYEPEGFRQSHENPFRHPGDLPGYNPVRVSKSEPGTGAASINPV